MTTSAVSHRHAEHVTPAPDGVVLEADGIHKTFRGGFGPRRRLVHVLAGADLSLVPGEIVGLIGENGSGKSTLMKILSGALPRDAGSLRRLGRIGYCPQDPILYERLTCDEHFALFGRAYGLSDGVMADSRARVYDRLGFGFWAHARVEQLSGGTRAKLNLGLALLPEPEVLLLDEPYAGFNWETYQRFWELTEKHKASGGAILIVSHFVTDEDRFDRVYHMEDGKSVQR